MVKVLALLVGGALSLVSLMAAVGLVVESGWVRAIAAVLALLIVPAVIVDRLLPENATPGAKGLPTDVFALTWLGLGVLFCVGLQNVARPALVTEAERLTRAGYVRLAGLAYFTAGVAPASEAAPASQAAAPAKSATPPASSHAAPKLPVPGPSASSDSEAAPQPSDSASARGETRKEKDAAALFEELAPSVVTVAVGDHEHVRGGGTGFLIDRRGTIATNHHVIEGAKRVKVSFMKGTTFDEPELLTEDAAVDLALLRVDLNKPSHGAALDVKPLSLGDSDTVAVGERALSIGNPLGLDHTLTDGLISARRVYEGRHWIQTSVPISPGNSGGPLFNFKGEVIGVTTASLGSAFGLAQNLNLAVPVNILKRLLKDEYPGRRKFGDAARSAHW
ncbi:MAG TPA: trypsin-like peptidase domain-containing protein [Polyangiaceae bacterium]